MGMDVYGKNPTSKVGEYFRNNVWWWRPLWDYTCEVAPDLIPKVTRDSGHYNDGAGLDDVTSQKLAKRLRVAVANGDTGKYAKNRRAYLKALPDEACTTCGGTGRRPEPPATGPGKLPCNGCESKGTKRPSATEYDFTVTNVKKFARFLAECGGFEIN